MRSRQKVTVEAAFKRASLLPVAFSLLPSLLFESVFNNRYTIFMSYTFGINFRPLAARANLFAD